MFKEFLIKHDACIEALDWLGERNVEQTWSECQRGDWLLWLVGRVIVDASLKKELVKISLECAKLSLSITADPRVVDCCNAIERWLAGEPVNLEDARKGSAEVAVLSARSASEAAEAARSAESAARSAAWASDAVWAAARAAAWSTWSAAQVAWSAVESVESAVESVESAVESVESAESARHLECADIVRKHIPWSTIGPLFEQKMQGWV